VGHGQQKRSTTHKSGGCLWLWVWSNLEYVLTWFGHLKLLRVKLHSSMVRSRNLALEELSCYTYIPDVVRSNWTFFLFFSSLSFSKIMLYIVNPLVFQMSALFLLCFVYTHGLPVLRICICRLVLQGWPLSCHIHPEIIASASFPSRGDGWVIDFSLSMT